LRTPGKQRRQNSKETSKKSFLCVVPDCPDPGGGLSAGQLSDCPGHPSGLSGGTHLTDNSDCPSHRTQRRTVRLTEADCPQFKSQKTNRIELVLDTVRWTLADCPRSRPGLSVGKNSEKHTERKPIWTGQTVNGGLSANCWRTVHEWTVSRVGTPMCSTPTTGQSGNGLRTVRESCSSNPEKSSLTSIFRFMAKSSPTATKLGEHDHKAVGELPLRGHRPI
jgi:hypothetical protein